MVSDRHSNTSERQAILSAEPSERRFQRLAKNGIRVLRGIDRLLLATGLVCALIYVGNLIYTTAMSQVKRWSFSQLKIDFPPAKYEGYRPAPDLSFRAEKRVASYKEALSLRRSTGLPHRIVVDEAHYFLKEPNVKELLDFELGSYTISTYRPSDLHPDLRQKIEYIITKRLTSPNEVQTLVTATNTVENMGLIGLPRCWKFRAAA